MIDYYRKKVYGVERLYIVDPKRRELVGRLTGDKTVTLRHLEALTGLGQKIREVPMPLNLDVPSR